MFDRGLKLTSKSDLSVLKNPFKAKCVSRVYLSCGSSCIGGDISKAKWKGSVSFRNGDTGGVQNFEHENFDVIVKQIHSFIETL